MHIYAQIHKQTVLYLTVCLYFNSHMMLIKQTLTTKTTFHEVPKILTELALSKCSAGLLGFSERKLTVAT